MEPAPPPGIALIRLAVAASDPAMFRARLVELAEDDPVRLLAAAHPDCWEMVRGILATMDHSARWATPAGHVRQVAQMFDRAARLSPEASVALYTLGDADALGRATSEITQWLDAHRLLDRARVLDIGCGIGRLELSLAGRVERITGIDVSRVMVAEAQRRCAGISTIVFAETSGTDLAAFADGSVDLVTAVDSFPYIVAAGGGLAGRMVGEAARVLVPGGHLAILNYAYEGGPEQQTEELAGHGRRAGLAPVSMGEQPFRHWDGRAFLLRKD
ncbi:MAG TPA: class I SAM-dependent methyltransferase [Devosia sp.]|nr:class I SAM-dependent methyltransferase [Devosia sp.]